MYICMHTYIHIYIAPKIVRTNLRRCSYAHTVGMPPDDGDDDDDDDGDSDDGDGTADLYDL